MLFNALVIALLTLAGAALPLFAKRSERLLHLFAALSTGVFLGVVFLHLLPEVAVMAEARGVLQASEEPGAAAHGDHDHDHDHGGPAHVHEHEPEEGPAHADDASRGHAAHAAVHPHAHPGQALWLAVLVGVVGLFLLENTVLRGSGHANLHHQRHATVGYGTLLGVSVHAFTAGLGLAAISATDADLGEGVLVAIVGHKLAESFSLSTILMLAGFGTRKLIRLILLFTLVTPAGILAGGFLAGALGRLEMQVLMALAAGTFLYVAVCDLLPEVFHHRLDSLPRIALLAAGVGVSLALH